MPHLTKTTCCEFHADGGAYVKPCSPLGVVKASLVIKPMRDPMVGCENASGTLNIHKESESCEVCIDYCTCAPSMARETIQGTCQRCGKKTLPDTLA